VIFRARWLMIDNKVLVKKCVSLSRSCVVLFAGYALMFVVVFIVVVVAAAGTALARMDSNRRTTTCLRY
jgi:hypothetical protein